jgi:hypothetical protein
LPDDKVANVPSLPGEAGVAVGSKNISGYGMRVKEIPKLETLTYFGTCPPTGGLNFKLGIYLGSVCKLVIFIFF